MDARGTPSRVLRSHSQDQGPKVLADGRTPRATMVLRQPRPVLAEPGPVPADHCLRLYEQKHSDHLTQTRRKVTQNTRSATPTLGRRPQWTKVDSWCLRARFSTTRSVRARKAARTAASSSRPKRSMRPRRIHRPSDTSRNLDRIWFWRRTPQSQETFALKSRIERCQHGPLREDGHVR